MAKYTIELGHLIKNNFDIGLNDYPIFSENHRTELNEKIIKHYYFREIGVETPELFKRYLNRKMFEIMPYYNKMYETELFEFDPLENFKKVEETNRGQNTNLTFENEQTENGAESGNGETTKNSNGKNRDIFSDTPQGIISLAGLESDSNYASTADFSDGENHETNNSEYSNEKSNNLTSTGEQAQNLTENITKTTHGKEGAKSYSEMIEEYRKIILNIDMMIIDELESLFMACW